MPAPSPKRRALLDATLAAFAPQSFDGPSTAQIAAAAGVATGTLFHYFPTKDDLLYAAYLDVCDQLDDAPLPEGMAPAVPAQDQGRDYLRHLWESTALRAQAYPALLRYWTWYRNGREDRAREDMPFREVEHHLDQALGWDAAWRPYCQLAACLFAAQWAAALTQVRATAAPPEQAAELLAAAFTSWWAGLVAYHPQAHVALAGKRQP
jgi:AcrR family transcriptional regulator